MAPNPKVAKACKAMSAMGIPEGNVKPVLKNLLKLFDNNWELIEDEHYRVLADAIFDHEEAERVEFKKREAVLHDDPEDSEPPLKRLRVRHQNNQPSASASVSTAELDETPLKRPQMEGDELSQTCLRLEIAESTHLCVGDKRTEPKTVSPLQQLETRIVCFKEPMVEPGGVLSPTENVLGKYHNDALIMPKSEPFTDDLPQFEVPLAMVCSALPSLYEDGSSNENHPNVKADGLERLESNVEDKGDVVSDTSLFDIASTPKGEVKISLIFNSSQRSGFRIPSLDAVLKLVEDKCLESYRITESSFSVMKLMREVCECFLAMGTSSTDDEQVRSINVTSALDRSKKYNPRDVPGGRGDYRGNFCIPPSSSNGSVKFQNRMELVPQIPRHLSPNGLDGYHCNIGLNKNIIGNSYGKREKKIKVLNGPESSNTCSVVVVQKHQSSLGIVKSPQSVNDITRGEERVQISLVNETSTERLPNFFYILRNIVYQNAYVNFALARISDEDCCSRCFGDCMSSTIPCACARETGGEFAYTPGGLIKEKFLEECISMNHDPQPDRFFYCKNCPLERTKNESVSNPCKGHLIRKFIKECWCKCGCSKKCGNRVVQRGITANLQVFLTPEGKGWGLRTLEDLPKGAFVCEYVGEIVTNMELYERNMRSTGNEKHTYPVLLDADWGSEVILKDEEALCLDATFYGNVARFINHRCYDANLVGIPVEVETPDHHYYHLAFFTRRKVDALEELTWDYGINFNDHNHPVKAFQCCCGSEACRDMKRSKRTKSSS